MGNLDVKKGIRILYLEYLSLEREELYECGSVFDGFLHQRQRPREVAQEVVVLSKVVERPQLGSRGLPDRVLFLKASKSIFIYTCSSGKNVTDIEANKAGKQSL